MWDGSKLVSWPGWEQEEQEAEDAQNAALAAIRARLDAIEAARAGAGLKDITVQQAQTWISNQLDSATTVAAVKAAVKDILLKMVPYILK
jgi:uncharacterized protein (DUF2267 family)